MSRIARVVIPGVPHHLVQRANRRQRVFFRPDDYLDYLMLMRKMCRQHGVGVWAYCVMPTHVEMIVVPRNEESLRRGIGEAHRRFTRMINQREHWRGHLWENRFASYPLDPDWLLKAARCIEREPVHGRLAPRPWDYRWSSAKAHMDERNDLLCNVQPLLNRVDGWKHFLREPEGEGALKLLRLHERTGRPLGSDAFIAYCERVTGRPLRKRKPGRKKRENRRVRRRRKSKGPR